MPGILFYATNIDLKIEITGSSFDIYTNGNLAGSIADSTNPEGLSGYAYSAQWNNYLSFDNISWTDAAGTEGYVPTPEPLLLTGDIKVFMKDEGAGEDNIIKPRLYIQNTGQVNVRNYKLFFFFKAAECKTVVLEDYYTPESDVYLEILGDGDYLLVYDFRS